MSRWILNHPPGEVLQAFADCELEQTLRFGVFDHISSCSNCAAEVKKIRELMDAIGAVEPGAAEYSAARARVLEAIDQADYRGLLQRLLGTQVSTQAAEKRVDRQLATFLGLRAAARCKERFVGAAT